MWILRLNRMTDPNIEMMTDVAIAETKERLEQFLKEESVPFYQDEVNDRTWGKSFRQNGPLEWFNPPTSYDHNFVKIKTKEEYMQDYDDQLFKMKSRLINLV